MLEGEAVLRPLLTASAAQFSTVTAGEVAASLAGLVSDVDRAAMTGELEEVMASRLRLAAADEVDGLDDGRVTNSGADLVRTRGERPQRSCGRTQY